MIYKTSNCLESPTFKYDLQASIILYFLSDIHTFCMISIFFARHSSYSFVSQAVQALFTGHYIEYHIVCALHADRADAAEIAYGLLYIVLDDSLIGRYAYIVKGEHC